MTKIKVHSGAGEIGGNAIEIGSNGTRNRRIYEEVAETERGEMEGTGNVGTRIKVHGGTGEIGGNAIEISEGSRRILLDLGKSFGREGNYFDPPFLKARNHCELRDLFLLDVIPRIDGVYMEKLLIPDGLKKGIEQNIDKNDIARDFSSSDYAVNYWKMPVRPYNPKDGIGAILLSHAHQDHYDLIQLADPRIPVYAGSTTLKILSLVEAFGSLKQFSIVKPESMEQFGRTAYFPGSYTSKNVDPTARDIRPLDSEEDIVGYRVKPIRVDHSVAGATAYLITTPSGKRIFYTGDLRFHGYLAKAYSKELDNVKNIDIMITEGTRIDQDDTTHTEDSVYKEALKIVSKAKGLVVVGFLWKEITRYTTMLRVARKTGRTLVIDGRLATMLRQLKEIKSEDMQNLKLDWPEKDVLVFVPRKGSMIYSPGDYRSSRPSISTDPSWGHPAWEKITHLGGKYDGTQNIPSDNGIRAYQIRQYPEKYIVMASIWEFNNLLDIYPATKGATYIRSQTGPFDEEMVFDEQRLINWLEKLEFRTYTQELFEPGKGMVKRPRPFFHAHASGHASGPELFNLIDRINPRVIIPVHTEHPEIFKKRYGSRCVVVGRGGTYIDP